MILTVCEAQRQPAVGGADGEHFVHQADDVLACGNTGDGPGENVIEHQGGDAELGEGAAQGLFHNAIDAAAGKHGAGFNVDGAHGKGEEHDAEDEPGSGFADRLFGDAAGVKRGRAKITENDGGRSPERNKGEHNRGRHNQPYAIRDWSVDSFRCSHGYDMA